MKVAELLDVVIAVATMPKKRTKFTWTQMEESAFKHCLTKTPVTARVEDDALLIRPANVLKFKELVDARGLGHCEVAQREIRFLIEHPAESFIFVHD